MASTAQSWVPSNEQKRFIRQYGDALASQDAALFMGAGVSRAAGFVDWKSLLREITDELGLDIDRETDLVALAQFHVNQRGTRAKINQVLIDELMKEAVLTPIHEVVSRLPVDTVWTTNYDELIERSFEAAGKMIDVKRTIPNLAQQRRGRNVTLYKMHGCVTLPDEAVLTKDDYEGYDKKRSLFSDSLKGDLIEKTFLFLGFSFTDPNIEQILGRVRTLLGTNQREHFCVMRRPSRPPGLKGKQKADFEYELRKSEHQSTDLRRFGIQTLWINEYSHLVPLLRALAAYVDRSAVFVSGAAVDPTPLGEARLKSLTHNIGERLIERGYRLVSGFGIGIGEQVVIGSLRSLYHQSAGRDQDRVLVRPFPRAAKNNHQTVTNTRHREDLLSRVGVVVVIAGNKVDGLGGTKFSSGVSEEVEIAMRMHKYIIPIGVTGHIALELWGKAILDTERYLPGLSVNKQLQVLGDSSASEDAILDALFFILNEAQRATSLKAI
jgi:Sir2- and TIR-associating SLOG family/SIR2-like domain